MNIKPRRRAWRASVIRGCTLKGSVGCLVLVMVLSLVAVTNIDISSGGSASTPRPNGTNESVLQTVPPSMYPHFDSLDPLPPRPGENFITYGAFLDCLAARLRVDRHKKRELSISSDEPFFPYLVAPITFEISELKAFTCNVSVPIKHFMIVHNYNLSSVKEFLDATAAVFAFTDRLQIRRFPRNRGYAGAINEAMRHALTFPFDEVPFFFMSNYDVRFSHRVLEEALPRIRTSAFTGKPLLESLRAEVATEPNEHTPPHFRDVPLRSTDGTHLLHTSPSLPDRVRYMSKADRRVVFKGMDGWYYLNRATTTAVWGLSRLAIETVGFFDENCYPAYHEDPDYLRRMQLLGLQERIAVQHHDGVRHLKRNLKRTEQANRGAQSLGDTLGFLRGITEIFGLHFPYFYLLGKPRMVAMDADESTPMNTALLPPDAWMLNEERRLAIEELMHMSITYHGAAGAAAEKRNVDAVIGTAPRQQRKELRAALAVYVNATELYREGNSLRTFRHPMGRFRRCA